MKAEFRGDRTGESEWMGVRVESADEASRLVFGSLDNEPVLNAGVLRLAQRLAVSYDNIRGHKKGFGVRPQDGGGRRWLRRRILSER